MISVEDIRDFGTNKIKFNDPENIKSVKLSEGIFKQSNDP